MTCQEKGQHIIFISLALVVLLFVTEGLLQVKERVPSALAFFPSPKGIIVKIPNANMLLRSEDETLAHVTTDTEGFSGSEVRASNWNAPHKDGNRPIVFLGDSFTQALQVDSDKKFTALLQKEFDQKRESVHVYNFAQDGGSLLDELAIYNEFVRELHPSLVILVASNHTFPLTDAETKEYILKTDVKDLETHRLVGSAYDALLRSHTPLKDFLRHFETIRHLRGLAKEIYVPEKGALAEVLRYKFSLASLTVGGFQSGESISESDVLFVGTAMQHLAKAVEVDGGRFAVAVIPDPREALAMAHHPMERDALRAVSPNGQLGDFLCGTLPLYDAGVSVVEALQNGSVQLYMNDTGHLTESGHMLVTQSLLPFVESLLQEEKEAPSLGNCAER